MKRLKLLSIVALIAFSSCSKNDDPIDTTPIIIEAKSTLDLNALANLSGNDATALIKFNGVAADQYTSEVIVGDQIIYKIDTNDATTVVRFIQYEYSTGSTGLWESLEPVRSAGWITGLKVKAGAVNNDEIKFNIQFQLEENGVMQPQKTYLIDPKIKIKSGR